MFAWLALFLVKMYVSKKISCTEKNGEIIIVIQRKVLFLI